MTTYGSFYARETTLWQGNVFKIYATDEGLFLARVSDRLYPTALGKQDPSLLLTGLGGVAAKKVITQPAVRKQMELEEIYNKLDPSTSEFLKKDERNFSIRIDAESKLTLVRSGGFGKPATQTGTLEMQDNGKKRKFALASSQTSNELEELIRKVFPNIKGNL